MPLIDQTSAFQPSFAFFPGYFVTGDPSGREQVLKGGQLILDAVQMGDISKRPEIFLAQCSSVRAFPAHFALSRRRQAAQNAQQTRLSASVWTAKFQQATRREREIHISKKKPLATDTGKVDRF